MSRPLAGGSASGSGAGKIRIRQFPTSMDEKYVGQIWELLKRAIQEIQRKNNSGLSFEELYRNAYTMVLHKHGERLYIGLRDVVEAHMREVVRPRVEQSFSCRFLETINDVWNDHTIAMVMIRDILMYMDRVYVSANKVDPVYQLGLIIFRDEVIRHNGINDKLRRELLDMVKDERKGQQINWLGLKNANSMLTALNIYESEFEQHFLRESSEFYKLASQEFLLENSASAYVKKVEQCIRDETARAEKYLEQNTRKKILEVVDQELIANHMQTVVDMDRSGVISMLENDKTDDIRRMYLVFSRVNGGLQVMCDAMSRWLRAKGAEITDPELQSEDMKRDPVAYISSLLELKTRCDNLLKSAFRQDKVFKNRMHTDFELFVNSSSNSAEFLTLFMDDKLKKGNRVLSDTAIDEALDKAMTLFRFLSEKDVFEHFYKRTLAKRLLMDRSVSDDSEKMMVSKLKTECGYQYTQKLELMFKDKELWPTMQGNFKDFRERMSRDKDSCEIQMRILTSGVWPTQNNTATCELPLPAQISFQTFVEFYNKQHNGRKLTLNTYLGNADVKAIFYNPINKSDESSQQEEAGPSQPPPRVIETHKILNVNTHQMAVLMLFNSKSRYSYGELLECTRIPEKELIKTLQSLSMSKASQRVLVRKGKGGKDLDEDDEFRVNDAFTSKLMRVKISTIADARIVVNQKDSNCVKEKIADDRKHEIECAIVRIMKSRKKLDHINLISEVIQQMGHRFLATPLVIKQRIEGLIERDYLARSKIDQKVYEYVS